MPTDLPSLVRIGLYMLVAVVVTVFLLHISKRLLRRAEAAQGPKIHIKFAYNVFRLFVILLAIATVGSQFTGFQSAITTILASSGIIALGISLAAQASLSNIIDGLFISMFKPFNIGDRITLPEKNNLTGTVSEINLRHTVITTFNNTSYIVPNSVISGAIIDNSNFHNAYFSYPVDVSVAYDSDLSLAMKLLEQAIVSHPSFFDRRTPEEIAEGKPAVTVLCRNFGASGIDLRCPMITRNVSESFRACSEVRVNLKKLYDENGITIPFQTIHFDNFPQ